MMYILPGILGFTACCLFDINKIRWNKRALNLFFVLGSVLLILSTTLCIIAADPVSALSSWSFRQVFFLIGFLLALAGEIYALFFALPFSDTFLESEEVPVIDHGWYRVCRHPGFWTLALVYLFLWLLLGSTLLFYAFIVYTVCNLIYIIVQDVYIFPQYIRGYGDYKNVVPFLVPNKESIQHLFK